MEGYQPYNASCPENSQTYLKNHAVLVLKCSCFEIFWNRKSDYFESFAIVIAKHFYVEFSFKKLTIVWNIFWILWIFIKLNKQFWQNFNFDLEKNIWGLPKFNRGKACEDGSKGHLPTNFHFRLLHALNMIWFHTSTGTFHCSFIKIFYHL